MDQCSQLQQPPPPPTHPPPAGARGGGGIKAEGGCRGALLGVLASAPFEGGILQFWRGGLGGWGLKRGVGGRGGGGPQPVQGQVGHPQGTRTTLTAPPNGGTGMKTIRFCGRSKPQRTRSGWHGAECHTSGAQVQHHRPQFHCPNPTTSGPASVPRHTNEGGPQALR